MSLPAEVVSTIQSFGMFAEGVPADDATCNAIIEVLKSLDNQSLGNGESPYCHFSEVNWNVDDDRRGQIANGIPLEVNADIYVEFDMGYDEAAEGPENRTLCACFRLKKNICNPIMHKDVPVTCDGLRELLAWVKVAAKDLQLRGPCPKCPRHPSLRIPTADYCARCCLQAAIELL